MFRYCFVRTAMSILTFIKNIVFEFFFLLSTMCDKIYTNHPFVNHTCLNMSRRAGAKGISTPPCWTPPRHPLDMLPSPVGRRGREPKGAGTSTVTFTLNKFEHLHGEYLYGEVQYIMGNGHMRLSPPSPPPTPPPPNQKTS